MDDYILTASEAQTAAGLRAAAAAVEAGRKVVITATRASDVPTTVSREDPHAFLANLDKIASGKMRIVD